MKLISLIKYINVIGLPNSIKIAKNSIKPVNIISRFVPYLYTLKKIDPVILKEVI